MYTDVEKLQKCGEEKLEEKANGLKKYKPMIGAQKEKLPNRSDAVNAIQNYLDGDLRKGGKLFIYKSIVDNLFKFKFYES